MDSLRMYFVDIDGIPEKEDTPGYDMLPVLRTVSLRKNDVLVLRYAGNPSEVCLKATRKFAMALEKRIGRTVILSSQDVEFEKLEITDERRGEPMGLILAKDWIE